MGTVRHRTTTTELAGALVGATQWDEDHDFDLAISDVTGLQAALDAKADEAGVGDMLSTNNLSDVANVATARTNLDVYSADEVDAAIAAVPVYTDEQARDAIGAALVAGANVTITPSDGADTITIAASTDAEVVRDTIGTALVAGTGITITPNDGADTITIAASGGGGSSADLEFFGDGSDGDVTISSGTTTLTRDMYYNNLTISGTGALVTAGWRVFVKGTLDISAAPAGAIRFTGTNGNNGNTNSGGGAVTASASNSVGGCASSSTAGATGNTGAGAASASVAGPQFFLGGSSGASGAGGAVGATAGGPSRTAPVATFSNVDFRRLATSFEAWASTSWLRMLGGLSAPGGGSGAGDGTGSGGGGGGGALGGGILWLAANTINRGGSTAANAVSVAGGTGGNGGLGNAGTNRGGGGGGAGGGGGWLYLIYKTLTGSTATNCLDATGGNGGNGANGTGTGLGGNGGGAGAGGRIQVFDLTAGTQTVTTGGAAVAGNAASGATGGTGATATATQVSL